MLKLFKYSLMVGPPGIEPGTNRLWADCSNHWAIGPNLNFLKYVTGGGSGISDSLRSLDLTSHPRRVYYLEKMAVGRGFEPRRHIAAPYRFSKPASSATWVTHHISEKILGDYKKFDKMSKEVYLLICSYGYSFDQYGSMAIIW